MGDIHHPGMGKYQVLVQGSGNKYEQGKDKPERERQRDKRRLPAK